MRASIDAQWQALCASLVPQLGALIDADRAAGRPQDQRLRVGLFSYSERMPEPVAPSPTPESTVAPATGTPSPNAPEGGRS
jgi:hypothetical protein